MAVDVDGPGFTTVIVLAPNKSVKQMLQASCQERWVWGGGRGGELNPRG